MTNSSGKGFPTANLQIGHTFFDIDDTSLWKFIGGLPSSPASWVVLNGLFNNDPETTGWGPNQGGAIWFNNSLKTYFGWDGTERISIAFGIGMNLYNYKRRFALQDDFTTGGQPTGTIGDLGWLSNGTLVVRPGELNHPGVIRLDTRAVSGTHERLNFSLSPSFNVGFNHEVTWVAVVNTVDANTTVRLGSANSVAGAPPVNGIYFEKLDGDTNWFAVTRAGGTQTRTDTGVAVSASYITARYSFNGSAVLFYINDLLVATNTTNIPVGLESPFAYIINSAAASKTMDVDYFEIIADTER